MNPDFENKCKWLLDSAKLGAQSWHPNYATDFHTNEKIESKQSCCKPSVPAKKKKIEKALEFVRNLLSFVKCSKAYSPIWEDEQTLGGRLAFWW